jgi:hypothetical protein
MEQQTNLPEVPIVLSVAAAFSVSSSSVERAYQDEDAEDNYDERPEDEPEVADVSSCFQKQSQADKYDYYAKD